MPLAGPFKGITVNSPCIGWKVMGRILLFLIQYNTRRLRVFPAQNINPRHGCRNRFMSVCQLFQQIRIEYYISARKCVISCA